MFCWNVLPSILFFLILLHMEFIFCNFIFKLFRKMYRLRVTCILILYWSCILLNSSISSNNFEWIPQAFSVSKITSSVNRILHLPSQKVFYFIFLTNSPAKAGSTMWIELVDNRHSSLVPDIGDEGKHSIFHH